MLIYWLAEMLGGIRFLAHRIRLLFWVSVVLLVAAACIHCFNDFFSVRELQALSAFFKVTLAGTALACTFWFWSFGRSCRSRFERLPLLLALGVWFTAELLFALNAFALFAALLRCAGYFFLAAGLYGMSRPVFLNSSNGHKVVFVSVALAVVLTTVFFVHWTIGAPVFSEFQKFINAFYLLADLFLFVFALYVALGGNSVWGQFSRTFALLAIVILFFLAFDAWRVYFGYPAGNAIPSVFELVYLSAYLLVPAAVFSRAGLLAGIDAPAYLTRLKPRKHSKK
ncbi:hypothetical protein AUJ65_05440 [Candidatus Micrarchaeota archaeon CG1_02_51_15]|nr:MAG: hypothetical protein AUJ65_05440 [Candidatus Micrarchaeota archaeon CG1_02_51_15]